MPRDDIWSERPLRIDGRTYSATTGFKNSYDPYDHNIEDGLMEGYILELHSAFRTKNPHIYLTDLDAKITKKNTGYIEDGLKKIIWDKCYKPDGYLSKDRKYFAINDTHIMLKTSPKKVRAIAIKKVKDLVISTKKKEQIVEKIELEDTKKYLCEECYQIFDKGHLYYIKSLGGLVCKECRKKEYFKCKECGRFHKIPNKHDKMIAEGYGEYCYHCFKKKFFQCENCGKIFPREKRMVAVDNSYCVDCYKMLFVNCHDCGTLCFKEQAKQYRNHSYCEECYRRFATIRDYNWIPEQFKFKKLPWENELYMGIELEIETKDKEKRHFEEWARKTMEYLEDSGYGKDFYIKHDGTINGFELVSHPFTLQYLHKKISFLEILKWLRNQKFTSYSSGNCGLHVHLNRGFFGIEDIQKIRLFFSSNLEEIFYFSKRGNVNNKYCKYEPLNSKNFIRQGKRQEGKYWALRLKPDKKQTIEFRMFRGTLYHPRFLATIQFCDALAHFVKEVGITYTMKPKSWNFFVEWARKQHRYEHFVKYIDSKDSLMKYEV